MMSISISRLPHEAGLRNRRHAPRRGRNASACPAVPRRQSGGSGSGSGSRGNASRRDCRYRYPAARRGSQHTHPGDPLRRRRPAPRAAARHRRSADPAAAVQRLGLPARAPGQPSRRPRQLPQFAQRRHQPHADPARWGASATDHGQRPGRCRCHPGIAGQACRYRDFGGLSGLWFGRGHRRRQLCARPRVHRSDRAAAKRHIEPR